MPFEKGKSGNPHGVKRVRLESMKELRKKFEAEADKAVKAILDVLENSKDDNAKLKAAGMLLQKILPDRKAVDENDSADQVTKLIIGWAKSKE